MTDELSCPQANHHEDTRDDRENDTCCHNDLCMAWAIDFDHDFFDEQNQSRGFRGLIFQHKEHEEEHEGKQE